jgi:phage terminase large subunit-like protein
MSYNSALASYDDYVEAVLAGTIPACKFIHLACERSVQDLHRAAIGDVAFPYYFDSKAADRAIEFIQLLQPSKGEWAGRPLVLLPWQKFILSQIFGWKRREDNTRRFRFAYIEVPRKNGKTTLLAGIGLYMLCADGEPGAEVYSAATTRDQAKEIWDEAAAMAEASLKRYVKVSKFSITVPKNPSAKFIALAAEGKTLDGKNVHCALIDELHEHPSGEVYSKLKTGTGARRQPLIVAITTQHACRARWMRTAGQGPCRGEPPCRQ